MPDGGQRRRERHLFYSAYPYKCVADTQSSVVKQFKDMTVDSKKVPSCPYPPSYWEISQSLEGISLVPVQQGQRKPLKEGAP